MNIYMLASLIMIVVFIIGMFICIKIESSRKKGFVILGTLVALMIIKLAFQF